MAGKFKISFSLDESDLVYFRSLFRRARREAEEQDPAAVVKAVRELIGRVRGTKNLPRVVTETMVTLQDLIEMLGDEDYSLPKRVASEVHAALSYFANPEDLIPDQVPGLGFLDDAIMIKLLEAEFKHELWGYRKFRKFRVGAEQRPWTPVARARLPGRLEEQRKKIRAEVDRHKRDDATKRKLSW